jgi:hypothetical protein
MIQVNRRHNRTFNQTFHLQARFLIHTRVPYKNDQMPDWQLGIFTDLWVQIINIYILDGFTLASFIVKSHVFGSTPI